MTRIRLNFLLSNDKRQFLSFFETPKLKFKLTTWKRVVENLRQTWDTLLVELILFRSVLLFLFCTLALIALGIEFPLETSTKFTESLREGITSRASCLTCNILANVATSRLFTTDMIAFASRSVCTMFRLQSPRVCYGIIHSFRVSKDYSHFHRIPSSESWYEVSRERLSVLAFSFSWCDLSLLVQLLFTNCPRISLSRLLNPMPSIFSDDARERNDLPNAVDWTQRCTVV